MWRPLLRRWPNPGTCTSRNKFRPRLDSLDDRIAPATFTVTSGADTTGPGTLRWAIGQANITAGFDEIRFNIPGAGVRTISLTSPLPVMTDMSGATIDGYSQPGASRNTLPVGDNARIRIALDGRAAGDADGLVITGGNSRIEGLAIENFRGRVSGGAFVGGVGIRLEQYGNNTIAGNFIGTTAAGTVAAGNGQFGILVISDSQNNTIGGAAPAARNLVSGNDGHGIRLDSTGNVVAGNYVGVNKTGNAALPNLGAGVAVTNEGNTIGGSASGAGNVLSANLHGSGLTLYNATLGSPSPAQTTIQGNLIGLGANGTTALGNGFYGIYLALDSRNVLVGGTEPGAKNVISSNVGFGVILDGGAKATIQGNYIGTDATGMFARGNTYIGVYTSAASDVLIGGATPGAGNLISGNPTGLLFSGTNNVVQGNLVGTNRLGTAAIPNDYGIALTGAVSAKVGGTDPLARNVVSGNRVDGIHLDTAGTRSNNILGNYVGTDITGTRDLGNGRDGIHLQRGATQNMIGGGVLGAGNLISGNNGSGVAIKDGSPNNVVAGNRIGTNAAGDAALGNWTAGVNIVDSDSNLVGGTATETVNVISGQYSRTSTTDRFGVFLGGTSTNNRVSGNLIGTNAAGTAAVPNGEGVEVRTAIGSTNLIGGTDDGAGNLISGNARFGMEQVGGGGLIVQGNAIGLNRSLTAALGNGLAGVFLNDVGGGLIGGAPTGENIISGNRAEGIRIRLGEGSSVMGNLIGTDALGTSAIPNGGGVFLEGADNVLVGGAIPGAGNLISGNTQYGVAIGRDGVTGRPGTNNLVTGNRIGTDAVGATALGNGTEGVAITNGAHGNRVGGSIEAERNVISGNRVGVRVTGTGTLANTIAGNYIGTDVAGNAPLGNRDAGVLIEAGAQNTLVGGYTPGNRNVISGNPLFDVEIVGATTNFNTVAGNYVGLNAAGNAPVLWVNDRGIAVIGPTGGTMIGGTTPGAGNVVSGHGLAVYFGAGARNVTIQGNYLGTDATGMVTVGNNNGVFADNSASESLIGGETPAARNIISGNNVGISLSNSGGFVHNLKIQGNWIGPDAAGGGGAPNGIGIRAGANATSVPTQDVSHVAVDSNVISHNGNVGINFYGQFVRNNVVVGNTITENGRSGILLQHGTNNNVIGGLTAAARNVISGNTVFGVEINKPVDPVPFIAVTRNTIQGNFIGTDATGTKPDPNGIGISIRGGTNNLIGGTDKGAGNVISANINDGVDILEATSKGNVLQGNFIGTAADGDAALGNGLDGIAISVDAAANVIGARTSEPVASRGNVIAFNGGNGVSVGNTGAGLGLASIGNTIRGNGIYNNALLGIDLGNDAATLNDALDADGSPNNFQNFPEMLSAIGDGINITFRGTLNSNPNQKFVIDVYATDAADPTGHGEGKVYLGSVTVVTNAAGVATFSFTAPELAAPGWAISATATRASTGDTSEFSKIILLT